MIFTGRMAAVLVTMALATGGAAWGVHALLTPTGDAGTDYGLDTNANGKFDFLVVEAQISIPQAGTWDVYADLSTSSAPTGGNCGFGTPVPFPMMSTRAVSTSIAYSYERYFFLSGTQTVRMAFQGTDIARGGVDGPYAVHARLSLGPTYGMGRPIIEPPQGGVEWNYTTKAYAVADFEQPVRPAFFTGGHTDVAVDVDSDGLADFLEIRADIHVNIAGRYSLNGGLTKGSGRDVTQFVGYAYRGLTLSTTDTSVWLRFRGDMIRRSNVDGPWNFTLTLYGPVDFAIGNGTTPPPGGSLMPGPVPYYYPETLCGSTSAYRAADFDDTMELARFTGHFEELTPDVNGDGTYDSLIVRAEVEVFISAGFDLRGVLRSPNGTVEVGHAYGQSWLSEGTQTVDFIFPGSEIRAAGIDGPYVATLSITPTAGGIDPSTTYTTRAYRAADFDAGYVNGTRGYWIGDLNATAQLRVLAIYMSVVRGNDMLAIVIQDTLTVTVTDSLGNVLNAFKESVYLPSGGSAQSFAYSVNYVRSGTYAITAVLGPPDRPVDQRSITVIG